MIHINAARKMLDAGEPVSLEFMTEDGEIVELDDAVCISSYFRGGFRRMKAQGSGEIRTVHDCMIISINDEEVYL